MRVSPRVILDLRAQCRIYLRTVEMQDGTRVPVVPRGRQTGVVIAPNGSWISSPTTGVSSEAPNHVLNASGASGEFIDRALDAPHHSN